MVVKNSQMNPTGGATMLTGLEERKSEITINHQMGQRRRWLFRTFVLTTLVIPVALFPVMTFATDLGPGCATDRPAIAHHAGGVIVPPPKDETAPIPCSTKTRYRTSEISVAITNQGTVLFQPAMATESTGLPIGLLRSTDQGATWNFVNPTNTPARTMAIDSNLWVDRDTGRIFWSNFNAYVMTLSDDDGKSWSTAAPIPMDFDHPQIFTGPPTASMKKLMGGYPNVVYLVVAGGGTCGSEKFCGAHLSKSLDGGLTWGPAVRLTYPPECKFPGHQPVGAYGLNGVVGRDGTIYVPFTPCERPYVAISHDEGQTFELSLVSNTETIGWGELGLGMDKQGNLYTTWTDDAYRLPYLAISRDNGIHWSTPLMIAAPGVTEAAEPGLVVGATGQVAVTYYGSKNSPGVPFPPTCTTGASGTPPSVYTFEQPSLGCPAYISETWSTYVTESFNALAEQPLFWSATLNDPSQPTWYGMTPTAVPIPGQPFPIGSDAEAEFAGPGGGGHVDYYGTTIAPDGTPWVGFFQECPFGLPVKGNSNCPRNLDGSSTDGLFGFVGRLVR
jgi:hypothetical protein